MVELSTKAKKQIAQALNESVEPPGLEPAIELIIRLYKYRSKQSAYNKLHAILEDRKWKKMVQYHIPAGGHQKTPMVKADDMIAYYHAERATA